MKKLSLFMTGIFLMLLNIDVKAQQQDSTDYFVGKWKVLVKGTPNGDATMVFVLDKAAESLTGVVQDTVGTEISKISNVELAGNAVTLYFTAQGYDVNLLMKKEDEDNVTGSLMGMFDASGQRLKKE
ncbi:MAG TPA: hypothetical protein VN040_20365 [Pseudosphingobacterium sp.]|nr:hypothetical protein [Pseudosphingobacterium sp.]